MKITLDCRYTAALDSVSRRPLACLSTATPSYFRPIWSDRMPVRHCYRLFRSHRAARRRRPDAAVCETDCRLVVIAALALSVLGGCADATSDAVAYRLVDYVAVSPGWVANPQIIPADPEQGAGGPLVTGWEEPSIAGAEGHWATGERSEVEFLWVGGSRAVLTFEVRPFFGPRTRDQVVELTLNEEPISTLTLEKRWRAYEISLPAESLRIGVNRLGIDFDYAHRPSVVFPGNDDNRELAARFRSLRIGEPSDRGDAPSSVPQIRVVAGVNDGSSPAAPVLEMPRQSLFELLIDVPTGGRFQAGCGASAAGLVGVVEVVATSPGADGQASGGDVDGGVSESTEVASCGAASAGTIDADLGAWAGRIVSLRLRTDGSERRGAADGAETSDSVRWVDPRVVAPTAQIPLAALGAGRLQALPRDSDAASLASSPGRVGGASPDLFIVLLDAARADAFSPYGAERSTPHIAALAADGTVFAETFAAAPWTGQSVPSLLTGRYPGAHGVQTWGTQLPESIPTLQELVGRLGYQTLVWSQHTIYRGNATLRRGFDEIHDAPREEPGVMPAADELFIEAAPTFAVIHMLPPDGPYDPPPPHAGVYSSWFDRVEPYGASFLNGFPRLQQAEEIDADHRRFIRDKYDENVAYADELVGNLVSTLKEEGRYDSSMIIVLSDHGEAFLEHGYFLHTRILYDEVLRVPLVIKWPGGLSGFASRVEVPTSLIDVAPTVASLFGVDEAEARFQGLDLVPLAFDSAEPRRSLYFRSRGVAPHDRDPRPLGALRAGDWKVIHDEPTSATELYNVSDDPGELQNLAAAEPLRARFLLQQLQLQRAQNVAILRAESAQGTEEELSPEILEQLRALGYIQ